VQTKEPNVKKTNVKKTNTTNTTNTEDTMKTTKKPKTTKKSDGSVTGLAAAATAGVATVQQLEDGLSLSDALTTKERSALRGEQNRAPDDVIERVIALGVRHKGSIAGIPFDPVAAQTALDDAKAARALATTTKTLGRRLADEALRKGGTVASGVTTVLLALTGMVRTPEGQALAQELGEIRSTQRAQTRKHRASKKASATAATAPAAAPAAEATPAPAAPPEATTAAKATTAA
jgi:hypothetical protein